MQEGCSEGGMQEGCSGVRLLGGRGVRGSGCRREVSGKGVQEW